LSFDTQDLDIATSALPQTVAALLERKRILTSLVDQKFGVVRFSFRDINYEVTTFRRDIYLKDFIDVKRYPDKIEFVKFANEDVWRRDLSINAVYFNPAGGKYLDYVEGLADIEKKVIRVIGDPMVRFQEDPIRLLRAVRFKNLLKFRYHPKTVAAISKSAPLLAKLSPTVVKKELQKIQQLESYPAAKQELIKFGLIQSL
jgi:poly(A) polymerase